MILAALASFRDGPGGLDPVVFGQQAPREWAGGRDTQHCARAGCEYCRHAMGL